MRARTVVLSLLLCVLVLAPIAASSLANPAPALRHLLARRAHRHHRAVALRKIRRFRHETWHWQTLMGTPKTEGPAAPTFHTLLFWRFHALRAEAVAARPPHLRAWLCLHRYEGSWSDSGDPYWGGLQMDRGFMTSYAPRQLLLRGWANRWTPLEQMWVAERALRRGVTFSAWPATARICGLI